MSTNERDNTKNNDSTRTKRSYRENAIDDLPSDQSSLGIMNMDNLKDFSDLYNSKNKTTNNEYNNAKFTTPRPELNKKSINLSDLVEESSLTASYSTTPVIHTNVFKPSEMSGRSTIMIGKDEEDIEHFKRQSMHNKNNYGSPSIEQILAASFSEEVRGLGSALENIKLRQSIDTNLSDCHLPRTADISLSNSIASIAENDNRQKSIRFSDISASANVDCSNEKFLSSSQVGLVLAKDHKAWKYQYADIPNDSVASSTNTNTNFDKNQKQNPLNLSEFSHAQLELSTNYSMGQFFDKRNGQLYDMIPNKSPTKRHRAVPLYEESLRKSDSFSPPYTDQHSHKDSIMSVSAIAARFCDDTTNDSPNSISNKLLEKKSSIRVPAPTTSTAPSFAAEDILYITQPVPLQTTSKGNGNVQVLKVEEFYGNLPLIKGPIKSTNIITADSIRRHRNQSKLNQFPDIEKIPFPSCDDDNDDKENYNAQLDATMSVTDSVLEYCAKDRTVTPEINIASATIQNINSINDNNHASIEPKSYTFNDSQRPRHLPSPAKSLSQQFSTMTMEPSQNYYSQLSPAKSIGYKLPQITVNDKQRSPIAKRSSFTSPTLSSAMPSPNSHHHISSSTERDLRPSPSPSKMKYLQPNRSRSRSVSPSLLSQYQASQCISSTNSLSSNCDHFGIKSSKGELCWNSTKLSKVVKKTFTIKNIAHRKKTVKLDISGPGFQMNDDERKIFLQASECRTITITFCPTVIGPAIGKITLQSLSENANQIVRTIHLYGYGGNTVVSLRGIDKGPVGSWFLRMGDTKDVLTGYLERSFMIYNKGPLDGVAIIQLKIIGQNDLFGPANIFVSPDKCIIPAASSMKITVTCKPKRNQMKKILKQKDDVITIGTLSVITGDEPNRNRLIGVLKRCKVTDGPYNSLNFLNFELPNSLNFGYNFNQYQESMTSISDLYGSFRTEDISLTINRLSYDETCNSDNDLLMSGMGDTVFFHTLMPNNDDDDNITTTKSLNTFQQSLKYGNKNETLIVHPKRLNINPYENIRTNNILTIESNFLTKQTFELVGNYRHLFICTPSTGEIAPGEQIEIDVKLKKTALPSDQLMLSIYMENGKIDVPIDVDKSHFPTHFR